MDEDLRPTPDTPEEAVALLLAGNRRFMDERPTAYKQDPDLLHAQTADDQDPYVAILACANSRVPVGMVFDEHIGRLFVARVAGAIATTEVVASLEYAVAVLGVKAIVVPGHINCRANKATVIAARIREGTLKVVPAVYDVATGGVRLLPMPVRP